jgi:hypothetical protein
MILSHWNFEERSKSPVNLNSNNNTSGQVIAPGRFGRKKSCANIAAAQLKLPDGFFGAVHISKDEAHKESLAFHERWQPTGLLGRILSNGEFKLGSSELTTRHV